MKVLVALVAFVLFFSANAAEQNLFDRDGYFALDAKSPFVLNRQPAKCRIGLVAGAYETGTALLAVTNDSDVEVRLSTAKTYPVCGDLMVFEVMARSAGEFGAPFAVIGITQRYRHIAHKHYRLTRKWRKFVAILPVPPDAAPEDRRWRGLIDVPVGTRLEIGRIALYPAKNDERIAGMADSVEDAERHLSFDPTLDDFKGPAPTVSSFVSSQVGNANPITALPTRRSDEIAGDNVLGAALTGDDLVRCPPTGRCYSTWSPLWTIADDEPRRQTSNSTFSTRMLPADATNATLTVRLAKPVALTKLRLTTRKNGLGGFPYDWHADVSPDGKAFRTVWTVTNFNARGTHPEMTLDGSPVAAIRLTADRIRPEGKGFGYFQLDRVEALDAAGENQALASKGATAETSRPMGAPALDRASYLEDAIVNCGIKTVLAYVLVIDGWGDNSLAGGCVPGSRHFENLTDNIRYLKAHGVKTYLRLPWQKSLFKIRTSEELEALKADYVSRITPLVKAWKGLVAGYPLGGEENQYCVLSRGGRQVDVPFFKRAYRELVTAASDAIHAIDPAAQTSVTSALFDFGWTEEHLRNGLAKTLDEVSVHIYRETDPLGSYPEKCYSFFVDGRRGLESERLFTRAEDEIKAFRALLDKYNPKLRFSSHEMSMRVGPYPKGMNSTESGQAKFALRSYVMHHYYGIGPSCWWAFNGGFNGGGVQGGITWGCMRAGEKLQSWFALRRFAALFDTSWKPEAERPVTFTSADERFYSYAFRRGDERLVACWTAVSMRDSNTGKETDAFVPGPFGAAVPEVECIDLLNGGVQKLNVERAEGGFRVRGLVMRDYPLVLRYSVR